MRCGAFAATLLLLPLPAQRQQPAQQDARPAVEHIGITVRDLPLSVRFYTEVLGFREQGTVEREGHDEEQLLAVFGVHTETARLTLGDEAIELTEFLTPRGRPMPDDGRSNDRWFQHIAIIVRDIDKAYAVLRRHRVRHASPRPQTLPDWNVAAAGIRAFYFQDPDGHPLEILQFPNGKGDPKWQRKGDDLFLGIDHTAIVVGDTEVSLRFWRDRLGLVVVGSGDNHGDEQEHLNNVFGAHLRITTLRGRSGPGVELLEYLTPRGGRAMPADTLASDLWHWTVTLQGVPLIEPAALRQAGGVVVSAPAALRSTAAGQGRNLLAQDPDGHRVLLVSDVAPATREAAHAR